MLHCQPDTLGENGWDDDDVCFIWLHYLLERNELLLLSFLVLLLKCLIILTDINNICAHVLLQ